MKLLKLGLAITAFASLIGVSSAANAAGFSCQVSEVAELFNQRVHVRCSNTITLFNPANNTNSVIRFVALAISDVQRANRFITIANAALLSGKIFWVDIPDSSATNQSGCAANDCRSPSIFKILR